MKTVDKLIKEHLKVYRYENTRTQKLERMIEENGFYYCEHCQQSGGFHKLHCHHLVFRSRKPNHPNLHHIDNLLILCDFCHQKFHSDNKISEKYIKERNLIYLFK